MNKNRKQNCKNRKNVKKKKKETTFWEIFKNFSLNMQIIFTSFRLSIN